MKSVILALAVLVWIPNAMASQLICEMSVGGKLQKAVRGIDADGNSSFQNSYLLVEDGIQCVANSSVDLDLMGQFKLTVALTNVLADGALVATGTTSVMETRSTNSVDSFLSITGSADNLVKTCRCYIGNFK